MLFHVAMWLYPRWNLPLGLCIVLVFVVICCRCFSGKRAVMFSCVGRWTYFWLHYNDLVRSQQAILFNIDLINLGVMSLCRNKTSSASFLSVGEVTSVWAAVTPVTPRWSFQISDSIHCFRATTEDIATFLSKWLSCGPKSQCVASLRQR